MKNQELFPKMLIKVKCCKKSCGPESCGKKRFVRSMLSILSIRFLKISSNPKAKMCTQIFNLFLPNIDIQNQILYTLFFHLSQNVSTTCSMRLTFFINKMTYTQKSKNSNFHFIIFLGITSFTLKNIFIDIYTLLSIYQLL